VGERLLEIAGERLRLVTFEEPFSFSGKINLGAANSEGEHLLLLNDDMEVATPDWIERMVMYSSIPEVGAVGGRLILEDGRLQHVGVRFENGLPGHPYHGYAQDFGGYGNEVRVAQNLLAVTGACLMTRRELFERLGGLPDELPVNYNDIDYCLKLRADGRRVVYDPDLVMYHFESSSRSSDVEEWEKEELLRRWSQMTAVDPYSNPNLRRGGLRLRAVIGELAGGRLRLPRPRPKAAAR
jgi:GT2 family glycosyltransferase